MGYVFASMIYSFFYCLFYFCICSCFNSNRKQITKERQIDWFIVGHLGEESIRELDEELGALLQLEKN